jgi:hypothetical protein
MKRYALGVFVLLCLALTTSSADQWSVMSTPDLIQASCDNATPPPREAEVLTVDPYLNGIQVTAVPNGACEIECQDPECVNLELGSPCCPPLFMATCKTCGGRFACFS